MNSEHCFKSHGQMCINRKVKRTGHFHITSIHGTPFKLFVIPSFTQQPRNVKFSANKNWFVMVLDKKKCYRWDYACSLCLSPDRKAAVLKKISLTCNCLNFSDQRVGLKKPPFTHVSQFTDSWCKILQITATLVYTSTIADGPIQTTGGNI